MSIRLNTVGTLCLQDLGTFLTGFFHGVTEHSRKYPALSGVHLIDYKVRVMDTGRATAALVRVLIESSDGESVWTTVGVSTDIINASLHALADSIEYKLYRDQVGASKKQGDGCGG